MSLVNEKDDAHEAEQKAREAAKAKEAVEKAAAALLGVVVARRLVLVWTERRQGLAGSKLHVRLVLLFSLVSVIPAILVAVFAGLFLNFGIQSWFSERVRTALEESTAVANLTTSAPVERMARYRSSMSSGIPSLSLSHNT